MSTFSTFADSIFSPSSGKINSAIEEAADCLASLFTEVCSGESFT